MDFFATPLVWPWSVMGALYLGLLVFTNLRGDSPATRIFSLCLLMGFLWIFTDLLEKAGVSLETKMLWRKISYLPIGLLPVCWLLLVLKLTRVKPLRPGFSVALFLFPAIFVLGAWTNDWHHLNWSGETLLNAPLGSFVRVTHGPIFTMFFAFVAALQIFAFVLLALGCRTREPLFIRQFIGFLVGQLIVFATNFLYVFSVPPFNTVDPTPLALGLASLTMAWGIFRFRSLDASSLARGAILESIGMPWFLLDGQDRLIDRNERAEAVLGMSASDLSLDLPSVTGLPDSLKSFLRNRNAGSAEFELQGTTWEVHGSWVEDSRYSFRAYAVFLIDVTESRLVRARLTKQERSLAVLHERERLARELHDSLGQQLGFLNLSAQALLSGLEKLDGKTSAAGLRKIAEVARQAHEEVRYFIEDSSGASRVAEGCLEPLRGMVEHFASLYEFRVDLEVDPRLGDDFLSAGDKTVVFRIIQEAIHNSRKHSQGPSALLRVVRLDDRVRFAVVDTGVGFDPGNLDQKPGFGLGIMRERARLHGLELGIESSRGAGTRVLLDVLIGSPQPAALDEVLEPSRGATKILVVDDSQLFVTGLLSVLEAGGYPVPRVASDGDAALELTREEVPDVVLMDIQMPGQDGTTVAKRMHLEFPEIRVVMLTVSASDTDLFEALRVGASAYLLKSLAAQDLYSTIDGLMRGETVFTAEMAGKILEQGFRNTGNRSSGEEGPELTHRQEQVLLLASQGRTYKEIGVELNLSERTIKYHMGEILERLHLKSRADATRWFRRL